MTARVELVSFLVGALAYLAASVMFFVKILQREDGLRGGSWLLGAGALAHLVYMTLASAVARVCPVESVNFALSVASLVATGAFLLMRLRWSLDALGVVVAPLGLVPLLGTRLAGLDAAGQRLPPVFLALHVGANLVGLALFTLAGASAAFYLFVERRLKQKRFASVAGRLPPLDTLDQVEHRFLMTGFPLLTLGIITGTVWAHRLHIGAGSELWRAVLSVLTWLVLGGVLLLRVAAGWRGRRAAVGTIAGLLFALLVLVGYLVRPLQAEGTIRFRGEVSA
ncbi:MAG: cytochrome c biogenesis protein CcsA [Myxococcales bacterium]|nr:cytochrome c biogenesis protein CcsA [Polyangiaceae bacterium]MDW8248183.1 cytochrome c biogenesis protein CcsA [Myxococcales bacterium]